MFDVLFLLTLFFMTLHRFVFIVFVSTPNNLCSTIVFLIKIMAPVPFNTNSEFQYGLSVMHAILELQKLIQCLKEPWLFF